MKRLVSVLVWSLAALGIGFGILCVIGACRMYYQFRQGNQVVAPLDNMLLAIDKDIEAGATNAAIQKVTMLKKSWDAYVLGQGPSPAVFQFDVCSPTNSPSSQPVDSPKQPEEK